MLKCAAWDSNRFQYRRRPMPLERIKRLALAAAITMSLSLCTAAQDLDNVTLSGKVTDQNGAVIPGATVTVSQENTKAERTTVTDGDGNYKIIQLSPGKYNVKAQA